MIFVIMCLDYFTCHLTSLCSSVLWWMTEFHCLLWLNSILSCAFTLCLFLFLHILILYHGYCEQCFKKHGSADISLYVDLMLFKCVKSNRIPISFELHFSVLRQCLTLYPFLAWTSLCRLNASLVCHSPQCLDIRYGHNLASALKIWWTWIFSYLHVSSPVSSSMVCSFLYKKDSFPQFHLFQSVLPFVLFLFREFPTTVQKCY